MEQRLKVMVVDDESRMRKLVRDFLVKQNFEVVEAEDGEDALNKFYAQKDIALIILDVMMPELDGFSTCKEIKKLKDIPVIMLSARGEEYDRIHGFELGIDDYVVKPFSPKELMMRVNAVISRYQKTETTTSNQEIPHEIYEREGLLVDFTGRLVQIDGKRVDMTPKEYDLLFYMVRNKGIALTREKLITEVWGYDYFGDDRTLDTHIKLLRSSLGEYRKFLVTLRGVGYRFEA